MQYMSHLWTMFLYITIEFRFQMVPENHINIGEGVKNIKKKKKEMNEKNNGSYCFPRFYNVAIHLNRHDKEVRLAD